MVVSLSIQILDFYFYFFDLAAEIGCWNFEISGQARFRALGSVIQA
jgi:hypothetical protein